jgi:hypothetical protein
MGGRRVAGCRAPGCRPSAGCPPTTPGLEEEAGAEDQGYDRPAEAEEPEEGAAADGEQKREPDATGQRGDRQ